MSSTSFDKKLDDKKVLKSHLTGSLKFIYKTEHENKKKWPSLKDFPMTTSTGT